MKSARTMLGPIFLASCLVTLLMAAFPSEALAQEEGLSCSAQVQWLRDEGPGSARARETTILQMLVEVSRPQRCLGAELALSAVFMDSAGRILCTGVVEQIAVLRAHVQTVALEINPTVLRTFARWRNEPGRRFDPPFAPLRCLDSDGRTELLDLHLEQATSLLLTATVLPTRGGLGAAQTRLTILR